MSFVRNMNHLVFSTKNREPWLKDDFQNTLYAYMGGIVREHKSILIEAGGTADHVHLLVALHQCVPIADLVRDIKSGSSRWMHTQSSDYMSFAWQTKYGAFSVSLSMEETVRNYIQNQKEHHRKKTYQDEFREMLDRHGFSYDERFMWE